MKPEEEFQALKVRTHALAAHLSWLQSRIRQIERGPRPSFLKARVDPDKCLGCGLCEGSCPAGAIGVEKSASIYAEPCIGCGRCVQVCPQGAISLHAERFNHRRQAGRSW